VSLPTPAPGAGVGAGPAGDHRLAVDGLPAPAPSPGAGDDETGPGLLGLPTPGPGAAPSPRDNAGDGGALPEPELTHVDASGRVRLVDVGVKPISARRARAVAVVLCSPEALGLLRGGRLPKGDGLAVARVAGILAAKGTPDLIPLCHPLALDAVEVELRVEEVVRIEASVDCHGRTGAEMEALTAAAVAGLTVIDMVKAVDRRARLADVHVVAKEGGASGAWRGGERAAALPSAGVVTVSDRCAAGLAADRSGPVAGAALARAGAPVVRRLVPDEVQAIRRAVRDLVEAGCGLVITTGGTGLAPRDVTPEALTPLFARTIPGLAEALRAVGARQTATAALSRTVAGVVDDGRRRAVVVALPGSPSAVADSLAYLAPLLPHLVDQVAGGDHEASAGGGEARAGAGGAPSGGVGPESARCGVTATGQGWGVAGADEGSEASQTDGGETAAAPDEHSGASQADAEERAAAAPDEGSGASQAGAAAAPDAGSAAGGRVVRAVVGPDVIDVEELARAVRRDSVGAVVTFTGVVRDHDAGRAVVALDYEAHPDAGRVLGQLLGELLADHPQLQVVAADHRTGPLRVGETAFAAAVAAAHRREAFAGCADLVDRVKAGLPVWKRQHGADGTVEWVTP